MAPKSTDLNPLKIAIICYYPMSSNIASLIIIKKLRNNKPKPLSLQ